MNSLGENGKDTNPTSNIEILRELTHLLRFPPRQEYRDDIGASSYKIHRGNALAWNLFNIPSIAVSRWFLPANTKFQAHIHNENEYIIVYEGKMMLTVEDKTYILGVGDTCFIPSKSVHAATMECDCCCIAITIPRAQEYPT